MPVAMLLAAAPCTAPQEFRPAMCPAGLPAITAVTVTKQAVRLWKDPSAPEDCRTFRPTAADMRRYFARTSRVARQDVHYTLPESACVASGTARFADGRAGRWTVDRFRIATLSFGGTAPITLYCDRRCYFRPFQW